MSLTSSASNQARKFASSHCGAEEGCCGDEEMGVSGVAVEEGASSSVEGRESVEIVSGSRLRFGVEGAWVVGCGVIVGVTSLSSTASLSRCAGAGVGTGVGVYSAGVGGGM